MGRDVVGLRIDKKSNMVNDKSNGTIRVAPKVVPEKSGKNDYEMNDDNTNARLPDDYDEKQDVLGVKSTNHQPEEKIIKADAQKSPDKKSTSPTKPASGSAVNGITDADPFEPLTPSVEDDKQNSPVNHANGSESNDSGIEVLPKSRDLHSPGSAKKSPPIAHLSSRKLMQPHCKNYNDDEDNWSLASSTATSVRMRVTVPVAPRFNCVNRLERRKEFYTKLEEKHKALEKEKLDYEARTKEEEHAAIKQLRRNMMYKANPVPSFYREGPPPKVELKKLPVTRAKSPNLSRRKSCGDAVKSTPEDKGSCGRTSRHSVGVYREGKASPLQKKASPITPKSKDQTNVRKLSGSNKAKIPQKQSKETMENSQAKEQGNADIAVQS
ncbi:protein WVD2-like 2 [Salvia miltiorrhiza]|uniref:protein WVD2-like 2 n=1 Tax=Salvia miltiorrhiza TaxID=226208 RepID=UPI0025AD36A6|nr:protein WVD2-like 2 [Salvia miltiorrhiza]